MNSQPSFSLKLLGSPSIQRFGGAPVAGQAAQRHRIALLALLARSPERGMSRDKLLAYLWPESETEHARNLLNVSVYVLRKALGEDAILSGAGQLRLNLERVRADVVEFEALLLEGERERALALYDGPFLDGFFLSGAQEFESWVERERDRLAGAHAKSIEELAEAATARGDLSAGARWWKERAALDPYDSRVARRLMQALEASGNGAAALQHAGIHERLLQEEFGVGPDSATRDLIEAIRQRRESGESLRTEHRVPVSPPHDHQEPRPDQQSAAVDLTPDFEPAEPAAARRRRTRAGIFAVGSAAAVLAVWGLAALLSSSGPRPGEGPAISDAAGAPAASAPRREPPARSIAVLSFMNLSADPAEEYFSDGLAEELIGALARIRALRVAARTSSFAFKGKPGDIRQIGEALNVATVLEGSVRRDGDRLLVTVQLIDVSDGFPLWSETYERRFTEIFDLQRDLALQIAGALEAELTPAETERLASRPTEHLEAYTAYLRGRHSWNQRTPQALERAIEHLRSAIAADPQFAQAHAGLAVVHLLQGLSGAVGAEPARELARTSALRAIELDPGIAEARTVLGLYLHAYEWNAAASEREFLQSIALDPNHAVTRQWYGNLLGAVGRVEEAVEQKQLAVELDPLSPALSETLAMTLVRAGRLDEAELHVRNAIELNPTYWRAHAVRGLIHEERRQDDAAIQAYEHANELARPGRHRTRADIARVLARSGRREEARRLIAQLRAEADTTGAYDPAVATALHALGENDAAFDWLERAFRQRHPLLPFLGDDARFAGLSREPRFTDLMRRVGMWP